MAATFVDPNGNEFLLESDLDNDRGSYAALFTRAKTFRARHLHPRRIDETATTREKHSPSPRKRNSLADTVLVSYLPLSSSALDTTIPPTGDAAALHLVLRHLHLRRQVEHPLLRSVFDVFYTGQLLAVPQAASPSACDRNAPVAAAANSSAPSHEPSEVTDTGAHATSSPCETQSSGIDNHTLDSTAHAGTALVILEEFVEGCSLADYADAVTQRCLSHNNAKLQRDAVAIGYQLALLLHYLHTVEHIVCRDVPFDSVQLDQNEGLISVRLPLHAARMMAAEAEKGTPQTTAAPAASHLAIGSDLLVADELRHLRAPEMRVDACWGESAYVEATSLVTSPNPGAADIWMLGVIMMHLCSLNHKQLAHLTRVERLRLFSAHANQLTQFLPSDTQDGILHLIRSCVETVPAKRPTAAGVLKSTAFVTNRSATELEQHRAVISIAEAVAQAQKRKAASPPALQPALQDAADTPAAVVAIGDDAALSFPADPALASLSLQDVVWDTTPQYRHAFFCHPGVPGRSATAAAAAHGHGRPTAMGDQPATPSLSLATQLASQDMERVCAQYTRLLRPTASPSPRSSADDPHAALRERVRSSRQLPRDMAATTRAFEELTERFAQLQQSSPEASFRLLELLLESFSSSPLDVAAVQESVSIADAVLQGSSEDDVRGGAAAVGGSSGGGAAAPGDGLEDSTLSLSTDNTPTDFRVATTLRVMPSMPEHMIASERAANSTAVLYNRWLKKEKKRHVKSDGY